jgi:hypothetical protein
MGRYASRRRLVRTVNRSLNRLLTVRGAYGLFCCQRHLHCISRRNVERCSAALKIMSTTAWWRRTCICNCIGTTHQVRQPAAHSSLTTTSRRGHPSMVCVKHDSGSLAKAVGGVSGCKTVAGRTHSCGGRAYWRNLAIAPDTSCAPYIRVLTYIIKASNEAGNQRASFQRL